ncbi:transposase [Phoenicibacter congonensis]|uniref:transposase n=1 Tax=Phoenicibacter congonensis TaxID=1944646 RepID=UPI0038B36519
MKWFNQKYARSGTLWNSRYYSKPIMDEQQMLQTVAYIFNNPVKAGMVKEPERYRWSSLKALESREFDAEACQILAQYLGIDNIIKYTKKVAHEPMDSSVKKVCEVIPKKKLSDLQAIDIVKKMVKKKNLGRVPSLSKKLLRRLVKKLLKMGSSISQISRITGMNRRLVVSLI